MKFSDFWFCFKCLLKIYFHMKRFKSLDVCNFRHGFLYIFASFITYLDHLDAFSISFSTVDNFLESCYKPVENRFNND